MFLRAVVGSCVALVVIAVVAACEDGATPEACSNIPPGGCPLSRGVACEDPACEVVYACRPGNVWELDRRCPPRDAPDDASVSDAGAAPFDASIDAPPGAFGGPGCESLQAPDCALGLALSCGANCCGCEDLYICEDNGWTLWGVCADGGVSNRP
jgi:hypothetical protein